MNGARVPQSFLEAFIMLLLCIPIAIYFLIKWLVIGIVHVVIALTHKK